MPDLLSGPEELEVQEVIAAYQSALDRLDPNNPDHAAGIAHLKLMIDVNTQGLEDETPSPKPCSCNPSGILKCENGHPIGPDGFGLNQPTWLPLSESV